jgi:O-antigen ligase
MAKKHDDSQGKGGLSAFKLFLIVVVLLLIPTTMEQLSVHKETVILVGRICVGLAALFFLYGLIAKAMRFAGLVLLVLIGARALANEGVVEVPNLKEWFQAQRDR